MRDGKYIINGNQSNDEFVYLIPNKCLFVNDNKNDDDDKGLNDEQNLVIYLNNYLNDELISNGGESE